ncbi:KAT8 regulatory NSL complex subunit 2 [Pseudolycoriella hygida]|uniref:KAT8 regulatory NSL complex subunit 2 n=1 Tax=Pseudolycoriella hygida TaxID=35572 RepID=A0A9Q0MLA0_9DIPT|nr:KAT8 regulatory NSL complex subunit 2 [Pseudolycoriella hygida]
MIRLQSLYIDQIHRLQYVLKDRRRKYLQNLKIERESLCSIHDQPKPTASERRMYERLKAMQKFHKRHGVEAVLHRKFIEKRLKSTEGYTIRPMSFHAKCTYTEGGVKCGERILPSCKFCRKHILEDKRQILFRPCFVEKSGVLCQEPVPNIFEDSTCVLHIELPPMRQYEQKKFESDSEEDDATASSPMVPVKEEVPSSESISTVPRNDIEMFSAEDVGNNVTICHDQDVSNQLDGSFDETQPNGQVTMT